MNQSTTSRGIFDFQKPSFKMGAMRRIRVWKIIRFWIRRARNSPSIAKVADLQLSKIEKAL